MIAATVTGCYLLAWLITARALFRYWRRRDTWTVRWPCTNKEHSAFYRSSAMSFAGRCCAPRGGMPMPVPPLVPMAMAAALFWPLVLAAACVAYRAPESPAMMRQRIAALESELDIGAPQPPAR